MKRHDITEKGVQNWSTALVVKAFLACMVFAFACVFSAPLAYADDQDASFMVAAAKTDGTYVLQPTNVPYEDGDTIQDALERADIGIEFTTAGTVDSIAGEKPSAGMYMYSFTDYETRDVVILNEVPANSIKALFISSADVDGIGQGHIDLLTCMRTYALRTDGLRNFNEAKSANQRAIDSLPSSTNAQAAVIAADFAQAIETYDGYMAGPKKTVTFSVTRAGQAVNDAQVKMVDLYGNITEAEAKGEGTGAGTYVAKVVAGIYAYQVMSANGLDGVRGVEVPINDSTQVNAELPVDEWFDSVTLRVKSNGYAECPTSGTSAKNRATQVVQNIVPDAVLAENDLAVYAVPPSAVLGNNMAVANRDYPLYTVYTGVDGEDYTEQISYKSLTFIPPYLVEPGTQGTEFTYEVHHNLSTLPVKYQVEICAASIARSPTLSGLSICEGATELLAGFEPYTKTYDVHTSADELYFAPEPRGTAAEGYTVRVDGKVASASSPAVVSVPESARTTPKSVQVVALLNGFLNTYTVNVHKDDAATVVITYDADVGVEVQNDAGINIACSGETPTSSVFKLLEGQTYAYVATKETYFHATMQFTAEDGSTVHAVTPPTQELVTRFAFGRDNLWGSGSSAKPMFEQTEGSTLHEQHFLVPDYWSSYSWLRAYPTSDDAFKATERTISYYAQSTGAMLSATSSLNNTGNKPNFANAPDAQDLKSVCKMPDFTTESGYSNKATFTVCTGGDSLISPKFTQDYFITADRILTLPSLGVSDGKNTLKMAHADSADSEKPTYGFDRDVRDYVVSVPHSTKSLQLRFAFSRPISDTALGAGGYTVVIDGHETPYEKGATKTQEVQLNSVQSEQVIPIIIRHDDPSTPDTSYRIMVRLMPEVTVKFRVSPANATVTVTDPSTGLRISPADNGTYSLISGCDYSYTVAARGYIGQQDTFMAHSGMSTSITLTPAPVNPMVDPGISSHWPYFRADADNNGVVEAKTPIPSQGDAADDPLLYWASKLGEGYDSGAAGCPILVDGYLYTYAGDKIYKLDTVTGETLATGTMVGTSSFAITPMTYAEGMVFVALSNGRIEAFNAATLESLWVYTSPNGGQPNCPITYHDGYIYTGFWNWANVCDFVCLTVTDEDPTTPGSALIDDPAHPGRMKSTVLDAKVALWTLQHEGGFYWAGAWAGDDYVLVGSDNAGIGAGLDIDDEGNATGPLFSIDPATGSIIDTLTEYRGAANIGNIRSTVVRDEATGLFYFCGRGGYLCEVAVNDDGTFDHSSARAIRLQNDASDGAVSATSTPVIYNGRAYVGADHGSYNAYEGQSVDVVDLDTGSVAYTVQMQGRPQTSGLLTTGYLADDGYVYIYYFDNYSPGKLRCFKDKPGQTSAVDASTEVYKQGGSQTVYDNMANVAFTPRGAQAQFCICSPIADEYGTIYFKNDSAHMMALGSPIEKLEVTEPPAVTTYGVGEVFEPAGMKVVATYANGATRDVTDYVEVPTDAFAEEGEIDVPVVFPYTMYQSGASMQDIGTAPDYNFEKPTTTVHVTVGSAVAPRLTTAELPHAVAPRPMESAESYEVQLSATGAPRDFTWTCQGDLPAGLTFNAETATISGTVASGDGGAYPLKVTCANSAGSAEADFTLEVYEIPRITNTNSVLQMTTGEPFSYQVQASGYPEPFVYALQEGYVHPTQGWISRTPKGLSIDENTGIISGTPLENIDSELYRMRVYASNAAGISVPANYRFSITGESLIFAGAPEIANAALGKALADAGSSFVVAGEQVDIPVMVTGEPEPTVTVEGLPDGLYYDDESGKIMGVANAVDDAGATVTVRAENGQGPAVERVYTMCVYEKPSISIGDLAGARYEMPYKQALGISGTPAPEVIVTGLPTGLDYDAENGEISGTPSMMGPFKVSVTATNLAGSFTKTYQLSVGAAPTIDVDSLPEACEGKAYTAPLSVSGSPAPTVTVENLPAGLVYNAELKVIAGTPTEFGSFTVHVVANNGVGEPAEKTFELVVRESFELQTTVLQNAVSGMSYEEVIRLNKPFASAKVDGLPEGLAYTPDGDEGTLTITGTPSAVADRTIYNLAISATSTGGTSLNATLSLVVEPADVPVEMRDTVEQLLPLEQGVPAEVDLADELQPRGRPDSYTWGVSEGSSLPPGLGLDSSTGKLSGTPTAAGTYSFGVTCTNGIGDPAQATIELRVVATPVDEPVAMRDTVDQLPVLKKDEPADVDLADKLQPRGWPDSYTWGVSDGSSLPPGLGLDRSTGKLSGTPTAAGSYAFGVTCTNGIGNPAQAIIKLRVVAAPDFGELSVGEAQVNKKYSASVAVAESDSAPHYTWRASAGSELPAGLNLDSVSGAITGTPTKRGFYDVDVTASTDLYVATVRVTFVVRQDIADAQIAAIPAMTYTGAELRPVKVYEPGTGATGAGSGSDSLQAGSVSKKLVEGTDYTVSYVNNVNVGTAKATIKGKGLFTGSVVRKFTIAKAAQSFTVSAKAAKVKYKKVKKKQQKLGVGKTLVIRGAQGKVSCKLTKIAVKKKLLKQAKKKIKLAADGTLTLKKKLKKGKYKLTIQVSAAGTANYKSSSKTVVVKLTVK